MDNAWEYNNHRSEEWMGAVLQGRQDKVFLMSKVCSHGRERQNIAIAKGFQLMTVAKIQALRDRVAPLATDGRFELFKSSKKFDADEGRTQHGFPTQDQMPT